MKQLRAKYALPALLCLSLAACDEREAIGGGWYAIRPARAPEAGMLTYQLARERDSDLVVVADSVRSHDFLEPDCVLYRTDRALSMACADAAPYVITTERPYDWELRVDSLRLESEPRIADDGRALALVQTIPLDKVRRAAASGPAGRGRIEPTVSMRRASSRDRDGRTPLFNAVASGDAYVVESLLADGADPNDRGGNGIPPLNIACGYVGRAGAPRSCACCSRPARTRTCRTSSA